MNTEQVLTVIQETEILGKKVKLYGNVVTPLFEASEVAGWLSISNVSQMLKQAEVTDEDKGIFLKYTLGGNQKSLFITEDAMYEVLMSSRKKEARPMRTEIKRYLKQIRLTGGAVESGRESEFIDKYFPTFNEDTKLSMVKDLLDQNQRYKDQIERLEPQAKVYVDLMTAQGYLQFIDVAAMVEIGRNKLFEFLRRCKVITKQSNYNVPYGRFTANGMFKVITSKSKNGHISSVTMVSPKGLNYIYNLMKKKNVLDKFDTATLLSKIQELEVA